MSTQKKIRDIERAIRKKGPDDPSLVPLNEKLKQLRVEREKNAISEKEKKFSQKYHMVKFIERRKLTRKIHRIERDIERSPAGDDSSRAALLKSKTELENKLTYVLYYPKTMKYIGLFGEDQSDEVTMNDRQKKIMKTAIEARAASLENGEEDRVAHAMQIEREGAANKGKNTLKKLKKVSEKEVDDEDDDDSDEEGIKDEEDSADESDDSDDENELKVEADDGSDSDSSQEQSNDGSDDQSDVSSDEDTDKKEDLKMIGKTIPNVPIVTKPQIKIAPKSSKPSQAASSNYDPDPFFVEEADGDTTGVDHAAQFNLNRNRKFGGNRGGRGGGRGGRESSKPLSKQESRLRSWQSGTRGGKGGRGRGRDSSERGNTNEGPSRDFPQGVKRKFDGENGNEANRKQFRTDPSREPSHRSEGRGDGRGRGFEARGRGDGRGRGRDTQRRDSHQPRAAWEEGGGVSAQSVTERVKQKLSGAIVSGSGKKISFD